MKCIYVYNPTSGRQKNSKNRNYILQKLKEKFEVVDCRPTQKQGDAGIFAREACGVYDVFVVSGGDGTVNEVINAIANVPSRPKIGYIPTGTMNDLAHSLKIPKNVKKAVKIILKGNYISHDIFKANATDQKQKKNFGKLAYFKYGIKEFFGAKPFKLTLKYDDQTITGTYALGVLANSRYVAGYKINKMASCNDGNVNIILINDNEKKGVSFGALMKIARLFLFGINSIKNIKNGVILKHNKFRIELPETTQVNLDGEAGPKGSFDFEVLKQHVDIFVK